MPDYKIYPSALIKFQQLLDYEQVAEEDWNKVSQAALDRGEYPGSEVGDYKLTPDEMHTQIEVELINSINRIEKGPMEAADKGTAFNEIVDCLIENRPSSREDCVLGSLITPEGRRIIRAAINSFIFDYDIDLCRESADFFKGSIPQYLAKAEMQTSRGTVELYGYIDEWVGPRMYDIKTTSRYDFGKFEKGWQRHIYPWCVIESGEATEIQSFTYWVVEWAYQRKGEPLTAKNVYEETYTYDHAESGRKIAEMLELFLAWLESRREYIQDRRIFGGENPEGWHGTPLTDEQIESLNHSKTLLTI